MHKWGHPGRPGRPWPFPGPFAFGGVGPRARRGDVRVAILGLLADRPMHGYEMIRELEARSGGAWRPSAGSIYPTLQLLQDEGLVASEEVEGRRRFSLTEAGRAEVERRRSHQPPWEQAAEGASSPGVRLRQAAFQVGAATMQAAHAGSEAQVEQVLEVLADARRRIYTILAEA